MSTQVMNLLLKFGSPAARQFAQHGPSGMPESLRVGKEVEGLLGRLGAAGVSEPQRPAVTRPLPFLLDMVTRPGYAATSMLQDIAKPSPGSNPFKGFMQGLRGERKPLGRDLMQDLGVSTKPMFEASLFKNNLRLAPTPAGVLGFLTDALNPIDPINWLTFGKGRLALTPMKKAAMASARAKTRGLAGMHKVFGMEDAARIRDAMDAGVGGVSQKFFERVGAPTPESLMSSIIKRAQQMQKGGHGVDPATIGEYMRRGVLTTGVRPGQKLMPQIPQALKARITPPLSRKIIGEIDIPGSPQLLSGLSKVMDRIRPTAPIQHLGKMFVRGFQPETVAPRYYKNILGIPPSGAGDEVLVKALTEGRIPDMADFMDFISSHQSTSVKGSEAWREVMGMVDQMERGTRLRTQTFQKRIADAFNPLSVKERRQVMDAVIDPSLVNLLSANSKKAFDMQQNFYGFMAEVYKKHGVSFHPLEMYIPFVPTGPLNKAESARLAALFKDKGVKIAQNWGESVDDLSALIRSADPNTRPRLLQALHPREINEVLGREWLTEDAGVALMRRGTSFVKGSEAATFFAGLRTKYGVKLDPSTAREWATERGYALVSPKVQKGGRIRLEMLDLDSEVAKGRSEFLALPREFAEAYNEYTDLLFNTTAQNAFGKVYNSINRYYKTIAYMWTPGHLSRDWTSNVSLLWQADVRNPRHYIDGVGLALEEMYPKIAKTINSKIKAKKYSFKYFDGDGETLWKLAREQGVIDSGHYRVDFMSPEALSKTVSTYGKPAQQAMQKFKHQASRVIQQPWYTDQMRDLTRFVDNNSRMTGLLDRLARGDTMEEAAVFVKKHLFDYGALTPFEQKFMKQVVPFYTWMRKNIPHQVEMFVTKPRKFATINRMMRNLGEYPEEGEAPEFLRRAGGVRIPWLGPEGGMNVIPNLAFADLKAMPMSMDQVRELSSSIAPMIRGPFEMIANRALYSGRDLERFAGEGRQLPMAGPVKWLLESITKKDAPDWLSSRPIPRRTWGHLLEQIPPLRNLEVVLDPENTRQYARLASVMGGPPIFPQEWAQEAAVYERRDQLRDLIRQIQQQGVRVPTQAELQTQDPVLRMIENLRRRGLIRG